MDASLEERDRLSELVRKIRAAHDRGIPADSLLSSLKEASTYPNSESLCLNTDLPDDVVADICLGYAASQRKLDRGELVDLVRRIQGSVGKASEAKVLLLIYTFQFNCVHPAGTDLLFFPAGESEGQVGPPPEEVADLALRPG